MKRAGCYLVLFFLVAVAKGQPYVVTIEDAIALTRRNHPLLQAARYDIAANQALKKTAADLGKTDISLLYGQYNSIQKNDNNLTISQTIPVSTLVNAQRKLHDEQIRSAKLAEGVTVNELIFETRQTFIAILYRKACRNILERYDSILTAMFQASQRQYAAGESNRLTVSAIELQLGENRLNLERAKIDIEIQLTQLRTLTQEYRIDDVIGSLVEFTEITFDSLEILNNRELAFRQSQSHLGYLQKKVEVSRSLPDIRIGFFSQTLIGTQNVNGQEQFFGSNKRFHGFQLGVAIPLWYSPYAAKIKIAENKHLMLSKQSEAFASELHQRYRQAFQQYRKNKTSVDYYRSIALPQAKDLVRKSHRAFEAGEADYISTLFNSMNALKLEESYFAALQQLHQSIIMITFLTEKPQ
jgi:cobalt-zinc-cadmium resistance protein CzcA